MYIYTLLFHLFQSHIWICIDMCVYEWSNENLSWGLDLRSKDCYFQFLRFRYDRLKCYLIHYASEEFILHLKLSSVNNSVHMVVCSSCFLIISSNRSMTWAFLWNTLVVDPKYWLFIFIKVTSASLLYPVVQQSLGRGLNQTRINVHLMFCKL